MKSMPIPEPEVRIAGTFTPPPEKLPEQPADNGRDGECGTAKDDDRTQHDSGG